MLGEKIAKLRKERGWSQDKLATIVGMSKSYISAIEQGKAHPRIKTLEILAKCLEVEVELLLRES